jgi:hypothetical protein
MKIATSISTLEISMLTAIAPDLPSSVVREIIDIISWRRQHQPDWYPRPGRTILYRSQEFDRIIKIKGAGFYNPPNATASGFKRTTEPVPEHHLPLPPLQVAFQRDLIHVDPDRSSPYLLTSVPSFPAPIGGMLLDTALNDREMFLRLNRAGVPANRPLAVFGYDRLQLNNLPMGVSVSALPKLSIPQTPHDIYLYWGMGNWDSTHLGELEDLGGQMCGNPQFSMTNPIDRLALVARLARIAGKTILEFSTKARLYRLSGSPDNFSMRLDPRSPLYLSDVDTAAMLESIDPQQQTWEVLRNLLTAIHQWVYFFLPALSHPESGYTWELIQQDDFIAELLAGFFPHASTAKIEIAAAKIWSAVEPIRQHISSPIALRSGEYLLQQHCPRPLFYFMALEAAIDLIQGSAVQQLFPAADPTPIGIHNYIAASANHHSHHQFFHNYSIGSNFGVVEPLVRGRLSTTITSSPPD